MKTKRYLAFASMFFAFSVTVSAASCGGKSVGVSEPEPEAPVYTVASDAKTGETLYFAENGASNYKIVVPENCPDTVRYAAEFLADIVQDAAGVALEIVGDSAFGTFDGTQYVVSVGSTSILKSSPLASVNYDDLNRNGFILSLQGNTVLIDGASGLGTVYGVQEFLSYTLSFDVLAADALFYNHSATVAMPFFETVKEAPDIPVISIGARQAQSSEAAALYRSYDRYHGWNSLDGRIWDSKLVAHSIETIVSQKEYPQWYNNDQICYSQEDSYDVIASAVAERVEAATSEIYFQLGNADTTTCCTCVDCTRTASENGGMGGAYVIWLNKIAALVEEKLEEDGCAEKEWYLLGLMYNAYESAPVVWNASAGKYEAINENVVCGEHVGVQYCPISACYAHAFDDPDCKVNSEMNVVKDLYGWAALTDTYLIWSYNTEFQNYFFTYDDFGALKEDIRIYKELGVKGIYFNMSNNVNSPFDKFRSYLISKWCWDSELEYETLYRDFFYGYYREAAPYMTEYFEAIRANLYVIDEKTNSGGCLVYGPKNAYNVQYWPYALLQSYETVVGRAYAALKEAGYSKRQYETMRLRVRADEMFCTDFFLRNYSLYFTEEEFAELSAAYYSDNALLGNVWRNEQQGI